MTFRLGAKEGELPPKAQLMYREVNSKRRGKPRRNIIVLNHHKTTRGMYRAMKKGLRNAPATVRASVRALG